MVLIWLLFSLGQLILAQDPAISVADLPQCAKSCLSNSTSVVATACTSLNVACLCNSPDFVSTFYCCLSTQCATSEQATALQFNQQQCAAVNATAPDFVGCSPLKTTSTLSGTKSATTFTPVNSGPFSTIASIVSEPATVSGSTQVTATFDGKPILTGTCTAPLFALVSATDVAQLFPQIGCAPNRQDCCPYQINTNALITQCPQDYFTTAGGCCPSGFEVYSTAIGSETPCFSEPSTTLIPATTPPVSGLVIVTNTVFSKRYLLTAPQRKSLSGGAIAGIAVGSAPLVFVLSALLWRMRRRGKPQALKVEREGTTFPLDEPVLPPQSDSTSPQELGTLETTVQRNSNGDYWQASGFSSPPAYEGGKPVPTAKAFQPHELPGSTYIDEHHPASAESDTFTEGSVTEKSSRTPMGSPAVSMTASPSATPVRDEHLRAISPGIISPMSSPRISQLNMR